MKSIEHKRQKIILRSSTEADVPALRLLVNSAYKELADMGFNQVTGPDLLLLSGPNYAPSWTAG